MEVGLSGSERDKVDKMSRGPMKSRDIASGKIVNPILRGLGLELGSSLLMAAILDVVTVD